MSKKESVKYIMLLLILISGCSSDLKTKEIAQYKLRYQPIEVINDVFELCYVENHAIAFSMLNGIKRGIRMPIIYLLTISSSLFMVFVIWKLRTSKFILLLPWFIILSGALGNIIDRIQHGFVIDFLRFHYKASYSFPVFNLADVLINVGLLLFLIQYRKYRNLLFPHNHELDNA